MFGKNKRKLPGLGDDVAMRIVKDGKPRDVSYKELLLSTNLTLEALMSVLVQKELITPEELLQEIERIRKSRENHGRAGEDEDDAGGSSSQNG